HTGSGRGAAGVGPLARPRSNAARASGVTTHRGLPHRAVAVFTAGNSPRAIQERTLSLPTRYRLATSATVYPAGQLHMRHLPRALTVGLAQPDLYGPRQGAYGREPDPRVRSASSSATISRQSGRSLSRCVGLVASSMPPNYLAAFFRVVNRRSSVATDDKNVRSEGGFRQKKSVVRRSSVTLTFSLVLRGRAIRRRFGTGTWVH